MYKQDDGENYLYYKKESKGWLVGPNCESSYAWIRNDVGKSDGESTSSSDTDSDSDDEGSHAAGSQKKSKDTRITPVIADGWKCKLKPMEVNAASSDDDDDNWRNDETLKVEPLPGG